MTTIIHYLMSTWQPSPTTDCQYDNHHPPLTVYMTTIIHHCLHDNHHPPFDVYMTTIIHYLISTWQPSSTIWCLHDNHHPPFDVYMTTIIHYLMSTWQPSSTIWCLHDNHHPLSDVYMTTIIHHWVYLPGNGCHHCMTYNSSLDIYLRTSAVIYHWIFNWQQLHNGCHLSWFYIPLATMAVIC